MKYLSYYFKLEFLWKDKWFTKKGKPKPIIKASNEFITLNGYVDYTILEDVFISGFEKSSKDWESILNGIKKDLSCGIESHFGNETAGLDININFSIPKDNLGDEFGIEVPLNWNLATPIKFQKIPTTEIIALFEDWCKFLKLYEEINIQMPD